jgi:Short C-terminal domain/Phospholipase_D-nuclease N-terminal
VEQVTLGADYPFLDVLWSMVVFFAFVIWVWLLFTVLVDVFRRHDISGWGKAGWTIFLIVLPYIGVLSYLIVNSHGMAERRAKEASDAQAQFDGYVRNVAGDGGGAAAEIERAKKLLDSGAISQAEYDAIKQKALAAG